MALVINSFLEVKRKLLCGLSNNLKNICHKIIKRNLVNHKNATITTFGSNKTIKVHPDYKFSIKKHAPIKKVN